MDIEKSVSANGTDFAVDQRSLAQILAAAGTDAPAVVKRYAPQPSSSQIIENMSETSRMAEKFALQRIDAAIERLQHLRDLVQQKCRANIESTIEFVRLIEDGLRDVERLEQSADQIAGATITT